MDENSEKSRKEELRELEEMSYHSYATYVAGRLLATCSDLHELADISADMFVELMRADWGCLMLFREKPGELTIETIKGIKQEGIRREGAIETNRDVIARILECRKPILPAELIEQTMGDFFHAMAEKTGMTTAVSIPLVAKNEFIGLINLGEKESKMPFHRKDLQLLSTLSVHVAMAMRNAKLYDNLFKSYLSTVSALAEAIETKDPYTRGHSDRVSRYASAIGRAMNLSEHEIETIRIAGILHDIGKIGVPEGILLKFSPLTEVEFALIKEHVIIGERIIEKADFPWNVKLLARHHHERQDGSGYPEGLGGDNIPLGSRILAVADTYEALRSDRPYRKGFPSEKAMEIIREAAGGQLDRKIVSVFLELVGNGVIE